MFKDGKFRFSLQFAAETAEQIQVGNLLEQLGNKKSVFVVEAVNAYLSEHPELLSHSGKVEITVSSNLASEQLERMIRNIVEERIATLGTFPSGNVSDLEHTSKELEADVAQMLENLDLFQ